MLYFLFTVVDKLGLVMLEMKCVRLLALCMEVYFNNSDDSY